MDKPIRTIEVSPTPVLGQASGGAPVGPGAAIAVLIFAIFIMIWGANALVQICDPNKILIISGRKYRREDGQVMGYRVIYGGRTLRIPVLETVKTMDLSTMPVPIEVTNAYSKGGTPLSIQAIANVKIARDEALVGNAIERFLGRGPAEISRVARETLEGNLRGVVATLTPEQLNEDRLEFAERIASDVRDDLAKLGLHLDTLKIQSVSDEVDYLNSIGRRQIANIVRDAEIAESNAVAEAEQIEAECNQLAEIAKTQTRTAVQEKENELRRITAEVEKQARIEEERTTAAAEEARARAQRELQAIRADLEKARLEVEQVLPAVARQQAQELTARGEAAKLREDASASAQANQMLVKIWQETGVDAAELFLVQQMEMVLKEAGRIPSRLHLGQVHVIDNGDGRAIASLLNAYPEMVRQFLRQSEETLGIPLSGTLSPATSRPSISPTSPVPPIPTLEDL
ncbi:SPFH domain-containing protein [Pseudanabaena sp. FACHB-2040]|uniref:flotillin family protein n=1 Tax=Pseudanabaena sp. FACHB-2040 TaxID=2692859 RepID=UPI00168329A3|nr:SPFH domain-containing protein [Pseudanabaena sp. FACHB-2040]MBD2256773.1 flotillin family protein [Pseudanabaena sp. FACHB-2040]